jgi:hypothetical protein
MILSPAQIAQYAAAAGFAGNDLATAVGIALAESGGNPADYNKEPQDVPGNYGRSSSDDGLGSYGLWQIYLAAHPEFSGENLTDPQTNANLAFSIYAIASGFRPWSTFTSGEYGMYLTPAVLTAIAPYLPAPATNLPVAPLTLDAATGQAINVVPLPLPATTAASLMPPPSSTSVLLWVGLGLAALWLFQEAM